jgi:signal transduction histidine kinase
MVIDKGNSDSTTVLHGCRMPGPERNMPRLSRRWQTARRQQPADPGLVLLRSVCHELRPPVSALTSLVHALEAHPSESTRTELARLAGEYVAHAEAILRQAAAAAYGMTATAGPPVPFHRILPMVTAAVPAERLAVQVAGTTGEHLVHPEHVGQILINLLTNAERHSPPGEPIHLEARIHRRGLRLTVADAGTLTPDLTRSLCQRTPPPGEKGLGLWVVRQLVAANGGTIRARSLTPRGLAVEVTLSRPRQ